MSEFIVNGDMFGRYVRIPTDFSKAMHVYKVVSRIDSNGYCDTPITYRTEQTVHPEIVPVLKVIHCGIDETKVVRVALADCEMVSVRADECDWRTNMGDYDQFEFYRNAP